MASDDDKKSIREGFNLGIEAISSVMKGIFSRLLEVMGTSSSDPTEINESTRSNPGMDKPLDEHIIQNENENKPYHPPRIKDPEDSEKKEVTSNKPITPGFEKAKEHKKEVDQLVTKIRHIMVSPTTTPPNKPPKKK